MSVAIQTAAVAIKQALTGKGSRCFSHARTSPADGYRDQAAGAEEGGRGEMTEAETTIRNHLCCRGPETRLIHLHPGTRAGSSRVPLSRFRGPCGLPLLPSVCARVFP